MTINFEAKTDRELLMLVAQQGEQCVKQGGEHTQQLKTLNGKVQKHESRIAVLEDRSNPSWKPTTKKGWFTGGTLALALMTLVAVFAAKFIEVLPWG